ncbi:MAG: sulfite exporter TauE/SafE family protein [Magnetococcales bacterium]|nr:sulfite exporter TauE/SafE family protein [Magnetococcales bacterium]
MIENFSWQYVWLFPAGIAIAIIAMSAGISGANFWTPVYLVVLGLDTRVSFWLAMFTMLFGFGAGTIGHYCQRTIMFPQAFRHALYAVVGVLSGVLIAGFFKENILVILFGFFVFLYGFYMIYKAKVDQSSSGLTICRTVALIGGVLQGMIATGLGKLLTPCFLRQTGVSPAQAAGTSVFIVLIADLFAVSFSLIYLNISYFLYNNIILIINIVIFVAPGVIVGGLLGPKISKAMSREGFKRYVGAMLVFVGVVILYRGMHGY